MKLLRSCLRDDNGQVVVTTAVLMVVLLSFVGMAIDVGHLRLARRQAQALADAAAMAGGLELRVCAATANCPAMQAAVKAAMAENNQPGIVILTNCATPGTSLTVTLNNAPCAQGANDPNQKNAKFVEAVVSQQVRTYFARLAGYDRVKVSARAEATRGAGPCIYALNRHIASAITFPVGLGVNSTCGVVDESDNAAAMTCLVAFGTAPKINVTGGTSGLLCGASPKPVTGVPVPTPADPMAYLPVPAAASNSCPTTTGTNNTYNGSKWGVNITLLGKYTFNPGVYCGGISILTGVAATVTFNPGVYILRDGPGPLGVGTQGGLNVLVPLAAINATGVMFYNQGNVSNPATSVGGFTVAGVTTLVPLSSGSFSAATSGTYGGVLFWQAKGVTTSSLYLVSLLGSGKFEGAIYEPSAKIAYAVSALASSYNILVADQLNFTGQILSTFGNNYAALANGSPLQGDTAVLVQ